MNRIQTLHALGQSIWYDNIQRKLILDGTLERMIADGEIRGVTSNPAIFHNAITKSADYASALIPMAWSGLNAEQIFWELAIEDIQKAADLFLPMYEETGGDDGYVSLEVNPRLAFDTERTIAEAQSLWTRVNRPNLMIKIPATEEGLPAIRRTIAAGINVNVTLIFSLERYRQVLDAFLSGLEQRLGEGKPIEKLASVASFFVSRVDTKVDALLEEILRTESKHAAEASDLLGKAAIANAKLAYQIFLDTCKTDRWKTLKSAGAKVQRPLWASTSTKNLTYRDVIYIEELIGPQTVNTAPPQTLKAFRDHGIAEATLEKDLAEVNRVFDRLGMLGIRIDEITTALEREGVKAFADAFVALLEGIDAQSKMALKDLGGLAKLIPAEINELTKLNAVHRLFMADGSLWTEDKAGQEEAHKRLGWLRAPVESEGLVAEIKQFTLEVERDGFTHVLLLGMGGSSLAPEVYSHVFPKDERTGLELLILDSTDPGQVMEAKRWSEIEKTLYVVASKSGGTTEINAFMEYFWDEVKRKLGNSVGKHFIAITDPGTSLEKLAKERGFRHIFYGDPQVGGRYSALTAFGLIPAGLMGINIEKILADAAGMMRQCSPDVPIYRNPGVVLGAVIGQAACVGRDKLTILADASLESFGNWLEQLVAESSGKEGKGIVPIIGEPLLPVKGYGNDRIFVYLKSSGELQEKAAALNKAGQPVLIFEIPNGFSLGGEYYRWGIAVAIACVTLGVNAFDQPDVQDSKTRTATKVAAFKATGDMPEPAAHWENEWVKIIAPYLPGVEHAKSVEEILQIFLEQVMPGDYVAINAYVPRNKKMINRLQALRKEIQKHTGAPTTLGFGPRFLHSTGQLHKGGGNNGVFLQITMEPGVDIEIPGMGVRFGVLERAQAAGDMEALMARNKRVLRVHLKKDWLKKWF